MDSIFDKKLTIKLVWILIFIFIIISFLIFVFFKYYMDWNTKEVVDYTTKIMLSMLAFFTLLYHLYNLENQINTQKENNKQNLAKYTYDICADFRKPPMMNVIETSRKLIKNKENLLKNKESIGEFIAHLEHNEDDKKSLTLILNFCEGVSAMVLDNALNNDIVYRLFGTLFVRYYMKLKYYIEYNQEHYSPKSWSNFEILAKKWMENDKK